MKLSRIIAKRFLKPQTKKRGKKNQSNASADSSTGLRFLKEAIRPNRPTSRQTQAIAVIPEAPLEPVVKIQKIYVEVPTERYPSGDLLLSEFIHPSEKLRSSLEGFILHQRSEHTQRAYSKDLTRFAKFLAVRKNQVGDGPIDRNVLVAYKDWLLRENLNHTTIDRHLSTLRSVGDWLVEEGLMEKNPASKVRYLKPKRLSSTNAFTDEEVESILSIPNLHTRVGAQHYAILMVLFYCGLRRSELVNLRTSNITVEQGHRIFRLKGKGNSERIIPIKKEVWSALKYYFVITGRYPREDRFLFAPLKNNRTKKYDKPIDSSAIFYIVTRYAKLAGIAKRVSPHSCRATAISNARDHNVSDRAIQEFAGWSSPDMITRYDKRKTAIENSAAHSIVYSDKTQMPKWMEVSVDQAEGLIQEWDSAT